MYKPQNISQWQYPDSYIGPDFSDYYDFIYRTRDSHPLDESNFICALNRLGGESDTVQVIRQRHWACGWLEFIAIHHTDTRSLKIADEIAGQLKVYPVLDEFHFSELELDIAENTWRGFSIADRVELCKKADISIFAARRDCIPFEDNGYIYEYCRW